MTDTTPQQEPETTPSQSTPPQPVWDVTQFEIRVTNVWAASLHMQLEADSEAPQAGERESGTASVRGELCSVGEQEHLFTSLVHWECSDLLPGQGSAISGVMALQFSHKPGLPDAGIGYYSQVNAPILAYPYIRELVAHTTTGAPFGPVVIDPLDVPRFVQAATAEWAAQFAEHRPDKDTAAERGSDESKTQTGPGL